MNAPARPHGSPAEHPTASSLMLAEAQQMDPATWSRLVDTFGPVVYRWCRASGVPPADAADVVQDVFVSVARGIGGFRREKPQGSFRSWLATITRNRVRDHLRRRADQASAAGGSDALARLHQFAESVDSTIHPEGAQTIVLRRVLESVRAEFEPTSWTAFWMTAVEGRTAGDVAAETGLSIASVYQSKSRVLKRLRRRLAEIPE